MNVKQRSLIHQKWGTLHFRFFFLGGLYVSKSSRQLIFLSLSKLVCMAYNQRFRIELHRDSQGQNQWTPKITLVKLIQSNRENSKNIYIKCYQLLFMQTLYHKQITWNPLTPFQVSYWICASVRMSYAVLYITIGVHLFPFHIY